MSFVLGVVVAVAGVIAAEIGFNYSLGDVVKDLFLKYVYGPISKLFGKKPSASTAEANEKK